MDRLNYSIKKFVDGFIKKDSEAEEFTREIYEALTGNVISVGDSVSKWVAEGKNDKSREKRKNNMKKLMMESIEYISDNFVKGIRNHGGSIGTKENREEAVKNPVLSEDTVDFLEQVKK